MENIKKIVVSLDNQRKVERIIIEGENKQKFSNKTLSNDELMRIYTKYVNILKTKYKDELDGLSEQEQVNKLNDMGLIEINNDVNEIENNEFEDSNDDYDEQVDDDYDDEIIEDDNEKDNKIRNFMVNHPFISGAIGAGAIFVLVHSGNKLLNKIINTEENTNKTTIELQLPEETKLPTVKPTVKPIYRPTMKIVMATPTPEIVEEEKILKNVPEIYFLDDEYYFNNYPEVFNDKILINEVSGHAYFTVDENLESLMEIRNQNMDNIENYVQSGIDKEDKGMYIYFENLFNDYSLEDKSFVKYFSMLGNQIIRCGYKDNNYDVNNGVNKYAKKSCYEFVRCVRDNEPLSVFINGEREFIRYSDLSYDAKNAVINIAWANYTVLNSYPEEYKNDSDREESLITEFTYNNESISKADVADIILTAYDNLSKTK